MADLASGELEPTRTRLERLLEELAPVAERIGSADLLDDARALVRENGAIRQRRLAGDPADLRALARALADRFLDPPQDGAR